MIDRRPAPPRVVIVPRPAPPRVVVPRYVSPRVAPRAIRPVYPRYYAFRPRVRVAFGLFIGYPVAYPAYYYPSARAAVVPVPPPVRTGGLSFDIHPDDATIYVDGRYMGLVQDYSPMMQPLSLAPGRHSVQLFLEGYETLVCDVDVFAGQVIPFEGALDPR